jgi:hypothetical protein
MGHYLYTATEQVRLLFTGHSGGAWRAGFS